MSGTEKDEIRFLGTAGARFVMITQFRSSAGTVLSLKGTNVLIDPGPGTLVRFASSKPRLNPAKLHAIILTHKHLDHSNDVNVMIEAMTEGGFKHRGVLLCPKDALSNEGDAVVLNYYKGLLERIEVLKEGGTYFVGQVEISTPKRHVHSVETYGLNIKVRGETKTRVSFIADTLYFNGLENYYDGEVLVINVAMYERRGGVDHLCVVDAKKIIEARRPKVAILTHFGMTMLRNKPWEIAKQLSEETDVDVIAARDGMKFTL
ncbi:MAG: MBL fold metallo-hydrolase [Methanophagales archaeon]|nr:MBL fold metallo-hydrolase [Methanophagales archaeon]MCW3141718.1 MBL fold metallo-hydrolase [Methanophagales archaeon]